MEFEEVPGQSRNEVKKGPHPDFEENISYYSRMKARCIFGSDLESGTFLIKPYKGSDEITGIQFSYGPCGDRKGCFIIELHQSHREFRKELCYIFNHLYNGDFLDRIDQ